jgi:hypothetical protein
MQNEFDELAKGLAQSVTRRGALKKFGLDLLARSRPGWGSHEMPTRKKPGLVTNGAVLMARATGTFTLAHRTARGCQRTPMAGPGPRAS